MKEKIETLCRVLKSNTVNSKIWWKQCKRPGTFELLNPVSNIMIYIEPFSIAALTYTLIIKSVEGLVIDEYKLFNSVGAELYDEIRRQVNHAEAVVENLIIKLS